MKSYVVKVFFIIGVLLLATLPGGCGGDGDEKQKPAANGGAHGGGHGGASMAGARASNVRTWTAVKTDVPLTIKAVGTIEAEEEVVVSAEVAAVVTDLLKDEGASVQRGTLLAVIDEEKFRLELVARKADFDKAEANLEFSEKDLARSDELLSEGMISQRDYDAKELKLRTDEAVKNSASAAAILAEKELRSSSVTAPFGGLIAERFVSKGTYVKVGAKLFRLIDTRSVKVSALVSERRISDIKMGQRVKVTLSSLTKEYEGGIYYISPDLDEGKRVFEIKVRVKNREGLLKPGLFADMSIITDVREGVFAVPEKAVIVGKDGGVFYVVKDGLASERHLPLIERDGEVILVASGIIEEGEEVVVEGANKLKDGSKVKVVGR
ncbi:MAG: efflux RND transporter periplasmic adaptor subunit [Deltaproteobacteria bacterium]|nr:efflux RND transporter periplasmic adaptor subunit [Deltaproteobacteria bacterium]